MKTINAIRMGGAELLPLVEGGKGVSVSTGTCSGHWAAAGGAGTISIVNADSYDDEGRLIPQVYTGRTRRERHEEMVEFAIAGGISQAREAHELSGGRGRLHANILWEMGAAERGHHRGAGRGPRADPGPDLRRPGCRTGCPTSPPGSASTTTRSCPPPVRSTPCGGGPIPKPPSCWAGWCTRIPGWPAAITGCPTASCPTVPSRRCRACWSCVRLMRGFGLGDTPIIMAGGVWWLEDWEDWIDNPELGPVAFQFGTRPLLTRESPIPEAWKQRLMTLRQGDISLNKFSPTGFYSSAVSQRLPAGAVRAQRAPGGVQRRAGGRARGRVLHQRTGGWCT